MASTASTISGVSCSASVVSSFVESDVRATERRSSRSTSFASLKSSRNYMSFSLSQFLNNRNVFTFNVSVFAIS